MDITTMTNIKNTSMDKSMSLDKMTFNEQPGMWSINGTKDLDNILTEPQKIVGSK